MGDKRYSVLIVDDDSANITALAMILEEEYELFIAKDGINAIEIAKNVLLDIILLDIIMPNMDGFETISILKEQDETRDIPVIFITGLRNTDDERKGLALGAVDYITKPFSPVIVDLRVKNQINIINQKRKILEKERNEIKNQTRIDFLMRVSHEMLTQMNIIMGMIQSLRYQNLPDNEFFDFDEIDTSSKYLLRLIHDLLDVSGKLEGSFSLNETVFSFDTMYRNILIAVDRERAKKKLTISHAISPSIQHQFFGDEGRLAQVITQLMMNAIKFTPGYGVININAYASDEDNDIITFRFEITDSGVGIAKENQRSIFNLFEQNDNDLSQAQGGIGLGLPISKRIVDMMGGEIWVESESGKGSTFIFTCKLKKISRREI